jgi:hypothetical protein
VRIPKEPRRSLALEVLRTRLQEQASVQRVEVKPQAGSLVVEYDAGALTVGDMADMVADVGFIALGSIAGEGAGLLDVARSAGGALVKASQFDRRFAGIASRTLDGRILAPIGLTALGVAFVICRNSGVGLSTLPPMLLAGAALAVIRQRRAARPHPAG